jgi:glycosyltransferase involved in cell wall biosynthesis
VTEGREVRSDASGEHRVDVGIPTRGRAAYFEAALASALRQTFRDIRVTVTENGPGDPEVADVIRRFAGDARLRHVVHGVDLGQAANFTAAAGGTAQYLALLHDDDTWEPEFLERRVEFLEAQPTCGFVFSGAVIIDGEGRPVDIWETEIEAGLHPSAEFLPLIYGHNVVPVPSVLIRRSAYRAIGGAFDSLLFSDHELWLRLAVAADVGVLNVFDNAYRLHGNQLTYDRWHRLGEHRLEFLDVADVLVGDRLSDEVKRKARAESHLHAAGDAFERGERRLALAETGRWATSVPRAAIERWEVRRASLLVAASLAGRPGKSLWRSRRNFGDRRADARRARKVAASLGRLREAEQEPLFTVVIPAWNAAATIADAIDSVLIQTCQRFEIVLVDDGSDDETIGVAQAAAGARLRVVRQERRGVAAARNAGIDAARAGWVSFLDADDLWLPDYLEEMRRRLEANPRLGLVFTDAWILDEPAGRIRRTPMMKPRRPTEHPPSDPAAFVELLLRGNFVYTSATVPKPVLERVGGYNAALTSSEDYDLWLRITSAGFAAAYAPGPLAVYRIRRGTLSSDPLEMARGELDAVSGLVASSVLPPAQQAMAERRLEQLRESIERLQAGRRDPLPVRLAVRSRRFLEHGRLFRSPPPEIDGAFPDLLGAGRRGR